jgi:hypothetical protein
MSTKLNADEFLKRLNALRSAKVAESHNHLASADDDMILGVRMGQVFSLAREFMEMPLAEVEKLLESPIHEARVGAVSIMDFRRVPKRQRMRAGKNCLTCISNAMTVSIPGIWWIAAPRM